MHILSTPIEYLKGVGPVRSELLKKELRIFTYEDLLMHFPFRYVDKSNIYKISEINDSMSQIQFRGKIIRIEEKGLKKSKRLIAYFQDSSGTIELIWFKSIKWIKQNLSLEKDYIVFGKPSFYSGKPSLVHPELDALDDNINDLKGLYGVYSSTEKLVNKGLNSRAISKLIKNLIPLIKNNIEENLSDEILEKFKLPKKENALINVHVSKDLKVFCPGIRGLDDKIHDQKRVMGYSEFCNISKNDDKAFAVIGRPIYESGDAGQNIKKIIQSAQ